MFRPYESKRAFEDVADQILQAIMTGILRDGERLPSERALADEFRAGRLTVREALRTLETRGLIRIKKGSGGGAYIAMGNRQNLAAIIVDNLTLEGLTGHQITEARIGLECAIVKSAIKNATPKDMADIYQDLEESKVMTEQDDPQAVVSKMINFHLLMAEASHNLPFIMFIRALMEWARRKLIHYAPPSEHLRYSYRTHRGICEAVGMKDADLAQRLMKKHIERMSFLVTGKRPKYGGP